MALQRSTHASCNMIRSTFQCLRRHACLCRGPLQLLEQPMHLSGVAAVSVCTAERRVHSPFPCSNWRTPSAVTVDTNCIAVQRCFHCSPHNRGLEEFFPRTDDIVEEGEQTGRAWRTRELRHKSNEDLHKLWYVLLKERNMLLTLRHDAKRAGFVMPGPERLKKVRKSMAKIKVVIGERGKAIREALQILKEEERIQQLEKLGLVPPETDAVKDTASEPKQLAQ